MLLASNKREVAPLSAVMRVHHRNLRVETTPDLRRALGSESIWAAREPRQNASMAWASKRFGPTRRWLSLHARQLERFPAKSVPATNLQEGDGCEALLGEYRYQIDAVADGKLLVEVRQVAAHRGRGDIQ